MQNKLTISLANRSRVMSQHALLIGLAFICVFPFYWMFISSLRPEADIYSAQLWPSSWTLDNYSFAWSAIPILRMLTNTIVMAISQTGLQLITSILAAYAFTRWDFPGKTLLLTLFALTWLVPFQVTMIPNYVSITAFGWRNTLIGLIVPNLASAFAILTLFQTFKSFPRSLIEAARVDGSSNWGILWRIIVPNLRASIAALGILLFISSWNEYFWPLIVTNKLENTTIQIGLQLFMSTDGNLWGPVMAAATLSSLPVIVIYLILQRQIIDSFVKWGLK